jgi:hypothetical protein
VRPIGDTTLEIDMQGQSDLLNSPMYLILGVPNSTSLTPDILSLSTGTASAPSLDGTLTSGLEAYTVLGYGDGTNNSNSFLNWRNADLAVNGINANYFSLFVYDLSNTNFALTKPLEVIFLSPLPTGTFAIAYGEKYKRTDKDGNIIMESFSTPFTESGLTQKVPEPSALLLLGGGLLGLALYNRRRFKK